MPRTVMRACRALERYSPGVEPALLTVSRAVTRNMSRSCISGAFCSAAQQSVAN
ncbi:hypothetical protein KCP77_09560 [Salmonella enterica subsp. enterica]|nr:hypothetical protein KCP77_09560 [Salmonella enterica subsp. enterica]